SFPGCAVPRVRRMPFIVSLTTACCMVAGDGKPAAWCALVMEVSLRWRLAGLWSAARAVMYRVTVRAWPAGREAPGAGTRPQTGASRSGRRAWSSRPWRFDESAGLPGQPFEGGQFPALRVGNGESIRFVRHNESIVA